jgi:HEAT repeat protein
MLSANTPSYRHLAIAASAIHRQVRGPELATALDDPEPYLQARALCAVGELKHRDLLPLLHQRFKAVNTAWQFWAAWSAVLLGGRAALDTLKAFATSESPFREQALQVVLRVMDVFSATK